MTGRHHRHHHSHHDLLQPFRRLYRHASYRHCLDWIKDIVILHLLDTFASETINEGINGLNRTYRPSPERRHRWLDH